MKALPENLYDKKTFFTLSGASFGVWILTLVLDSVFGLQGDHYRWIGLLASLLISFIGISQVGKYTLSMCTVAFFNGLLIFVSAAGIDSVNASFNTGEPVQEASLIPFTEGKQWFTPKTVENKLIAYENIIKSSQIKLDELQASNEQLYASYNQISKDYNTLQQNNSHDRQSMAQINSLNNQLALLKKENTQLKESVDEMKLAEQIQQAKTIKMYTQYKVTLDSLYSILEGSNDEENLVPGKLHEEDIPMIEPMTAE